MSDALGSYVRMLVKADTNRTTTFVDLSPYARMVPVSGYGNVTNTASPIASIYFDGNGDYLKTGSYTHPGTADCTLECFYRPAVMPTTDNFPGSWSSCHAVMGWGTPGQGDGFNLYLGQTEIFAQQNAGKIANGAHGMSVGTLYHLCLERYGTSVKTYVDGVQKGTYTIGSSAAGGGSDFYVGSETAEGAWLNGYITQLRYTMGVARYQGEFSVPSSFDVPDPFYVRLLSPKRLNPYFGGGHRIAGTASKLGAAGAYGVLLYDRLSGMLLARTTSASDGSFAFTGIEYRANGYRLVAEDGATVNPLNAAVADLITPVAMT